MLVAAGLLVMGAVAGLGYRALKASAARSTLGDDRVGDQGYGDARLARELALWRGTLRRLHVQASHQNPPSDAVQRQIAQAEARIAEAERQLAEK